MNEAVAPTNGSIPRIGEPAPQFEAQSTHGLLRLSDYEGKWVVLFSHPADFTPVCTTEFIEFARQAPSFEALDTQLIGLSVDSVFSHLAWIRNIEGHSGTSVAFPVIADSGMEVARRYGMLHPEAKGTATVRAVFVIDPEQIVRALVYYPLSAGRAIEEIHRLVQALQVNAAHGLATPEGWRPGDACIVPPPVTQAQASERADDSRYDVTDWYLARTPVPNGIRGAD